MYKLQITVLTLEASSDKTKMYSGGSPVVMF